MLNETMKGSKMSKLIEITPSKTYKTRENASKAFEAKFSNCEVRYYIMQHSDGRFFPVALGQPALQAGVHFHFNVIG